MQALCGENYLVSERRKMMAGRAVETSAYFWRTTQQQEIDYIEECGSTLAAFEFKWNPAKRRVRFPKTFTGAYPEASTETVQAGQLRRVSAGEGLREASRVHLLP